MENLIAYIKPELLVVALALYFVGMLLKKIERIHDNYIPVVLGVVGVVICIVYLGFMTGWTIESFTSGLIQGCLCAASSTYVNQVIKQMAKLNKIDKDLAKELEEMDKGDNK